MKVKWTNLSDFPKNYMKIMNRSIKDDFHVIMISNCNDVVFHRDCFFLVQGFRLTEGLSAASFFVLTFILIFLYRISFRLRILVVFTLLRWCSCVRSLGFIFIQKRIRVSLKSNKYTKIIVKLIMFFFLSLPFETTAFPSILT